MVTGGHNLDGQAASASKTLQGAGVGDVEAGAEGEATPTIPHHSSASPALNGAGESDPTLNTGSDSSVVLDSQQSEPATLDAGTTGAPALGAQASDTETLDGQTDNSSTLDGGAVGAPTLDGQSEHGSIIIPADLPGLEVWYSADQGVTLSGSNVTDWLDQSGNSRDLQQLTGSKQPTFDGTDSDFNGVAALYFNGAKHLASASSYSIAQPFTLMMVYWVEGPITIWPATLYTSGSSTYLIQTPAGQRVVFWGQTDFVPASTGLLIEVHVVDGASSKVYRNGGSNLLVTGNLGTNAFTNPAFPGTILEAACKFAQIAVCSQALGAADINAQGNAWATKYGLNWTDVA